MKTTYLYIIILTLVLLIVSACGIRTPANSAVPAAPATLQSINILPNITYIQASTTQQYTAYGQYSDWTTKDITTSVLWASSNPAVASVSATGLVSGIAVGSTSVTASLGGIKNTFNLTVGLTATPPQPPNISWFNPISGAIGTTVTLYGSNFDPIPGNNIVKFNNVQAVVASATATTITTTVPPGATTGPISVINSNGTATSLNTFPSNFTVVTLSSIAVTGTSSTIPIAGSQTLSATATYSDTTTANITTQASWLSSNPAVASVASGGVVTGVSAGTANITASLNGVTSPIATVTVGGTNVSGIINTNTVWTLANSPYIVTGNVLVNNGVTLTIQPGVVVKFNNARVMQVDGTLIAQGTALNKITFTSNLVPVAAGDWGYILFSASSTPAAYDALGNYLSGSILENTTINYTGALSANLSNFSTGNGAIIIDQKPPFINMATISNSTKGGIGAYILGTSIFKITNSTITNNTGGPGISTQSGVITIANNTVSNNNALYTYSYAGGIDIQSASIATISNNTITGNTGSNYRDGGGIGVTWGTASVSANTISNNVAYFNGGGIYGYYSTLSIASNTISNNQAVTGGGVQVQVSTSTISHNTINGNTAQNGSGISYWNTASTSIASYNAITNNITTAASTSTIMIQLGNPTISFNNITGNTAAYELYNNTSPINAANNWWGTAVDAQIQAKIYDWVDNATLGVVTYIPFASAAVVGAP